ncbi:MAG: 50S ribosomal protein L10 [Nanoarchaeota archaeon]|nr:50S ribosomal protein L10 [Nanoarchaeota archaeon]
MTPKNTKKSVAVIPERKTKEVETLKKLVKNKKTILIASIKNIPGGQFQEIGKKLRGKAIVKVPKKSLIFRALDQSGNEAVKKLKESITESVAILFSDLDSFELAAELIKNKSPAKAKAGQEAPKDIVIEEGPTDLVPGPAISELGALGIQIQIDKGKIHIKQSKVLVKEGGKISAGAAALMNKLDIRPFTIGFIPVAAFDIKEGKLYLDINIDPQGTLGELKEAYSKALAFSVEIGYPTKETITFLLGKAASHEKALNSLAPIQEKSAEDKIEETQTPENKPSDSEDKSSESERPSEDSSGEGK